MKITEHMINVWPVKMITALPSEAGNIKTNMPIILKMKPFCVSKCISKIFRNSLNVHMTSKSIKLNFAIMFIQVLQFFIGARTITTTSYESVFFNHKSGGEGWNWTSFITESFSPNLEFGYPASRFTEKISVTILSPSPRHRDYTDPGQDVNRIYRIPEVNSEEKTEVILLVTILLY